MKNINNSDGFTLVEIMVSLLITGIMMVFVFQFIFDQINGYKRQEMITDTQQTLRMAMDDISRDLRMAGAGIPNVPIYTGIADAWFTSTGATLPQNVVYPIIIIQGGHTGDQTRIFRASPSHGTADINDSLIMMYKDQERPTGDTVLAADMPAVNSQILVSVASVNGNTGFAPNVPIIITNPQMTKADLFMVTGTTATASGTVMILNVSTAGTAENGYNNPSGHQNNYVAATAADGVAGYVAGSRIFAVRVVRYDWSDDMNNDNEPITRLVNADVDRDTTDSIGENFGDRFKYGVSQVNVQAINAMSVQWAPPTTAGAAPVYSRGMPVNPYGIGTIRVTLTAHTAINPNVATASSSMFRVRTLTQEINPRNYN